MRVVESSLILAQSESNHHHSNAVSSLTTGFLGGAAQLIPVLVIFLNDSKRSLLL
jgi:hypothetical protein